MNETLKRALSGGVYIALLLVAITYNTATFIALFGVFLIITVFEYCKLVHINYILPILISIVCYGLVSYITLTKIPLSRNFEIWFLAITILISINLIFFLFNFKQTKIALSTKFLYLFGYIIFPIIIISKIPFGPKGYNPKIIISIFILIWTNDTFAYIVGKSIGKHKLLEVISPKKTIEGFVGGVVFAGIAGYFISKFYFNPNPKYLEKSIYIWTITAVIVGIFGTIGDLIESKFKRMANVKDSGKIMPGHGGILDRLDSVIFVAPFVYLFYQILNYVTFP
jgi:phosphatidate cytidylyltransferase